MSAWYEDAGKALLNVTPAGRAVNVGNDVRQGNWQDAAGDATIAGPAYRGAKAAGEGYDAIRDIGAPPTNPTDQAARSDQLRQDPTTGLWMDPKSSEVYQLTPDGQYIPVHDHGMRAQVAQNLAKADYYAGIAQHYDTSLRGTMGQQQSLADAYKRTIDDPNAPSVARAQLQQALGAADATQVSQAAGASGANAFIARRNAANNMAMLNAKEGQAGAELRAGEVANAQKGLADTYAALGNESLTAGGTAQGTGVGFANNAAATEAAANSNETTKSGQNKVLASEWGKNLAAAGSGPANPAAAGAA